MTFCFTGEFLFGTRNSCERAVLSLGAMTVDRVSKKLNYLVIGSYISHEWISNTYGRKIEQAVKHRDIDGADLVIISEQQWAEAIMDAMR